MTRKQARRAGELPSSEVQLDRLLGRRVLAGNNQAVGRLEEFRLEQRDGNEVVAQYVIGVGGLAERFGVGIRLLFGAGGNNGYVARWDQLDIADPDHPRLTCPVDELVRTGS